MIDKVLLLGTNAAARGLALDGCKDSLTVTRRPSNKIRAARIADAMSKPEWATTDVSAKRGIVLNAIRGAHKKVMNSYLKEKGNQQSATSASDM